MKAAPAARALLDQASMRWPSRSRASDGIIPSAAHSAANPNSDHEPNAAGLCRAVDLTHDPAHGCDCGLIAEAIRQARDPRVKYVIFNRRIWNPSVSQQWRVYSGSSPHDKHMHVSLRDVPSLLANTSPWPGIEEATMYLYLTITDGGNANLRSQIKAIEPGLTFAETANHIGVHVERGKRADRFITFAAKHSLSCSSITVDASSHESVTARNKGGLLAGGAAQVTALRGVLRGIDTMLAEARSAIAKAL